MKEFIIKEKEVVAVKINGKLLPLGVKSFAIEGGEAFLLELAFSNGENSTSLIEIGFNKNFKSDTLELVALGENKYLINLLKQRSVEEVLEQRQVVFGGRTHELTRIRKKNNRVVIECADRFYSLDFDEDGHLEQAPLGKYLFLYSRTKYYVLLFDKDYFLFDSGSSDSVSNNAKEVTVTHCPLTMEAYQIVKKYELMKNGELRQERTEKILREGNFNEKTLGIAFFERLKYLKEERALELLTKDFDLDDLKLMKEFLGKYDSVEKIDESYILSYESNRKRAFTIQICGKLVGNISNI